MTNIFEYHDINNLIFSELKLVELHKIYTLSKNVNLEIKKFIKTLPKILIVEGAKQGTLKIIDFLNNVGYEKLNYTPIRIKFEINNLININKFNYLNLIYISNFIKESIPYGILENILQKVNDENLCFFGFGNDKILISIDNINPYENLLVRILLYLDLKKNQNMKIYINKTSRTRPFYNNKKSLYFKNEELEEVDKILKLL